MSKELEDDVQMAGDKVQRTQLHTTQNLTNTETESGIQSSCQSVVLTAGSSTSNGDHLKRPANNASSSGVDKYVQNGCDVDVENNKDVRNSASCANRAALFRNIYDSSSSEDEDEHCVYTYRGSETAPDGSNALVHANVNGRNGDRMSACSSPEMDFLEMDFDPGPSNEQDSDSDSGFLRRQSTSHPRQDCLVSTLNNADRVKIDEVDAVQRDTYDENANCYTNQHLVSADGFGKESLDLNTSRNSAEEGKQLENPCCSKTLKVNDVEMDCADTVEQQFRPAVSHHSDSSDDELSTGRSGISNPRYDDIGCQGSLQSMEDSDNEDVTFIPNVCNSTLPEVVGHQLSANFCDVSLLSPQANSDHFFCCDELLPVDPSCSISAVLNVMEIMFKDFDFSERETLINSLRSREVPESTPLVEYLFMRSVQNANEKDLQTFASKISKNKLHSRFFNTYPSTDLNIVEWLCSWMRKGAVPVVTRNIKTSEPVVHDSWRHNVICKIESRYIHVLNPYEKVLDRVLHHQLSHPPVIHIARRCILEKWHSKVDLRSLMRANHNRWYNENVLGQVVTIIRENENGPAQRNSPYTRYVRIPSNCRCGITLFVLSENSILCREIDEAEELTSPVHV